MMKRPVLRYYGGKWRLAPWIISFFPPHKTYVEPYGGAASVLMRKKRSYAEVYNDLDEEVVNVFRILRGKILAEELKRLCELTPYSREEFENAFEPTSDLIERARRTVFKSFAGFGTDGIFREGKNKSSVSTGFRSNTTRKGSIPSHNWASYPRAISAFCERLEGIVLEHRPALEVVKQYDLPETLFYLDPPYVRSTRKDRNHGYRHEMSDEEHRELAETLAGIKGMAIVSGYRSELYDELYQGWKRFEKASSGKFAGGEGGRVPLALAESAGPAGDAPMTYMIRLRSGPKEKSPVWYRDSILDFVPPEVIDMMWDVFVEELGLCKLCEEMSHHCHVLQPIGRPHEYRKLCTILFHDAVKPDWELSEVV